MLACPDQGAITFPCLVSPKLDGIRALVRDGVVLSRKLLPIPNKHVQERFGRDVLQGFDGELICGPATEKNVYNVTESAVMSIDGTPDVVLYVFDLFNEPTLNYESRYKLLLSRVSDLSDLGLPVRAVKHHLVKDAVELKLIEENALAAGYEGAMARSLTGPYKYGRSTKREGFLTKIKRFEDAEAVIIGLEEMQHNGNAADTDELGHTKRSHSKAGKTGKGTLGKFVVQDPTTGTVFRLGTGQGLTQELRQKIWDKHTTEGGILGLTVKYKHFAQSGVKDKPRIPVWLGFRSEIDL